MRLHKNALPMRACKRGTTDAICYPKLVRSTDGKNGTLISTDGDMIVNLPVEVSTKDKDGLLPPDALRAAREHCPQDEDTADEMLLDCGATVKVPHAGQVHDRPTFQKQLFEHGAVKVPSARRKDTRTITINTKALLRVAQTMGAEVVVLHVVPDADKPIRVEPGGKAFVPGAVGAMLQHREPMTTETSLAGEGADEEGADGD